MTVRKRAKVGRARAALASIYKRMSAVGSAGLARVKKMRRNRTGPDHLAADEADFAYIEKEAHDILAAIARLRERDAGEYPTPEWMNEPLEISDPVTGMTSHRQSLPSSYEPSESAKYLAELAEQNEFMDPVPETQRFVTPMMESPGDVPTDWPQNMTRGSRRRNRSEGMRGKPISIVKMGTKFGIYVDGGSIMLSRAVQQKLGFSDIRPLVVTDRGGLDFGPPNAKPHLVSKKSAKELAHRIGRYYFGLGDMVFAYTEGY